MLHRSIGIEPPAFIVAGPRITEVSLSPTPVVASAGSSPAFIVSCIARPSGVVAHSRKRLRGSAHSVGNVPDACMFGFQGSLSGKALRKQICLASCGENPPHYTLGNAFGFLDIFIFLSPFNGHFSARCQVSHRIYFCCGRQRGGRAEALSSHLSMDIFLRNLNHREKIYFCCGSERNNGGVSRNSRVWGRHSPNKIPMGQNERTANYGTSVESLL